jgi:hypothetical protein
MFPPGKQSPQLQELSIACCDLDGTTVGPVTTAELHGMISACPALSSFNIMCVLAADVDVSVLLQLPATCCSLEVGGQPFGDSTAGVNAQLTQLTYQQWNAAPGLTDAGLQPLTALSRLRVLRMYNNPYLSSAVVYRDGESLEDDIVDGLELETAEDDEDAQVG